MDIKIAVVQSNSDVTKSGYLWCRDDNSDTTGYHVYYTSPYLSKLGSFVAIPPVNSRILICLPDNDNEWHYLTTTTAPPKSAAVASGPIASTRELIDPSIYRARGTPMQSYIGDLKGNKIVLSSEYNEKFFNTKLEMKSGVGKGVRLVDSPKVDSLIVENEHADRVIISSKPPPGSSIGPRSIQMECRGSIDIISRSGDHLNLTLQDGKEINIENNSTGTKRANSSDTTPGNINIKSKYADINLTVGEQNDQATIFIEAKGSNSHIVLKSAGTIDIDGDKGVNITSGGEVRIQGSKIYLN